MSVDLKYRGNIAIITINNPSKLGALTKDMISQLGRHMRTAANEENIFITLLTGTGRFFSSGADLHNESEAGPDIDQRRHFVHSFAELADIAHTFYTHPKILITALNGPVVGLTSALVSHSDFIYAAPHAYLLAPFNSIGIVVEGAATRSMINRMGTSKAKEALLMAKKISLQELVACGFVNGIFDIDDSGEQVETFNQKVLEEICEARLGGHLSQWSVLRTKKVMSRNEEAMCDGQVVKEMMGGVEAFESGYPQAQFKKLLAKEKRHKL